MMKTTSLVRLGIACVLAFWMGPSTLDGDEPATETAGQVAIHSASPDVNDHTGVPLDLARDRAQVMRDIYVATLHALHRHYFHGDRAMVPARAMKDIFTDIKRQSTFEARWISVSLPPMSIGNEPTTEFEKLAAKEIEAGKDQFESIDGGYYQLASSIELGRGCIGCHGGVFNPRKRKPEFAGLVIRGPRSQDASQADRMSYQSRRNRSCRSLLRMDGVRSTFSARRAE